MRNKTIDVFVSHSHKDKIMAFEIYDYLKRQGLKCFMAPHDMKAGSYSLTLMEAIEQSRVVLVLITEHSNASPAVHGEVEKAFNNHTTLLPVRMDEIAPAKEMELFLRSNHWFNLYPGNPYTHIENLFHEIIRILQLPPRKARRLPLSVVLRRLMRSAKFWFAVAFVFSGLIAYAVYKKNISAIPGTLTVQVKNTTPNLELPFEGGTVTVYYGKKPESKPVTNEDPVTFTEIPPVYKKGSIKLLFEAPGFTTIDTLIPFPGKTVVLPVRRNDAFAWLKGIVKDSRGMPLAGVSVNVKDLSATTNNQGFFELCIPFAKQQQTQRLFVSKSGYRPFDRIVQVIANETMELILNK